MVFHMIRRGVARWAWTLMLTLIPTVMEGATITMTTLDAVVWDAQQTVRGVIDPPLPGAGGFVEFDGRTVPLIVSAAGDSFRVEIQLPEGESRIVAKVDSSGATLTSDTLRLSLGYRIRPEVEARATVAGRTVTLHGSVLDNPDSAALSFLWAAESSNPEGVTIQSPLDTLARAEIPASSTPGDYAFSLTVVCSDGDTVVVRAMVSVDSLKIRPFDIRAEHASWVDSAIIYGITPSTFVENGRFTDITNKIPEIASLGVNTLWIQPVYATYGGGQGYDVIDYFAVRPDLGTEGDLRELIAAAHAHGLRVLLDFIPNHSSIHHPYAAHSQVHGEASHYYDFYQRANDGAPYSQHYRSYQGFINYFWDELPNFNYANPELQRMILEAGKYWVEKFGVDGYRVDAVWGVNARNPDFMKQFRVAVKRIRPDALLLAEDKATWPSVFEERFDVAYDWAPEEAWVSHWVWQTSYSTSSNPTVFNYSSQSQRASLLRGAMTNHGQGYSPRARVFRFMENNDTFRFISTHDLARTRMVAAFLFSIPGVPLIFNGQETGFTAHPYYTFMIYHAGSTIQSADRSGLFPYYRQLAAMRKRFPALYSETMEEVPVSPGTYVYAYRRWQSGQHLVGVMNLSNASRDVAVALPVGEMGLDSLRTYYLTDQLTNLSIAATAAEMQSLPLTVPPYTTRVFVLDTLLVTGIALEQVGASALPVEYTLEQNYPNPFNPLTTIHFSLPQRGPVRLVVYDAVGREVMTLIDAPVESGHHAVEIDATMLASGVYFCRMTSGSFLKTRKMILLR